MATVTPTKASDRKLQLKEVLDWLVEDGMVAAEVAAKMLSDSRYGAGGKRHPVTVVAEARLRSTRAPSCELSGRTGSRTGRAPARANAADSRCSP